MRSTPAWPLILGLALAACKPSPFRPDAAPEPPPDALVPTWWTPKPGDVKDWDVQLRAPYDLSAARAMYMLELFEVVPAQRTLDYGDGDPVTVPAGPQAGAIATLHARTPRPYVICRVGTGAIDLDDPDARKFPGYSASPPDRPIPPAPGSVIGWTTGDPSNPNERFLDIRAASRPRWQALVFKRFELAEQIGCDAIYADRSEVFKESAGFGLISDADQTSWFEAIAGDAHAREISIGMQLKNAPPAQMVQAMADRFDWVLLDRCAEFNDCGRGGPFRLKDKATLALDFQPNSNNVDPATACNRYAVNVIDGLVKDETLSSSFRHACP